MRALRLAPLAATVFVVAALGGRAYAYWTTTGSGVATAQVAEPDAPVAPEIEPNVGAASPLTPGGRGALVVVLHNRNDFAVRLLAVRDGVTDPQSDDEACDGGVVRLTAAFSVPDVLLEPDEKETVTLEDAVEMDTHAPTACQGATFRIPIVVEVSQ